MPMRHLNHLHAAIMQGTAAVQLFVYILQLPLLDSHLTQAQHICPAGARAHGGGLLGGGCHQHGALQNTSWPKWAAGVPGVSAASLVIVRYQLFGCTSTVC